MTYKNGYYVAYYPTKWLWVAYYPTSLFCNMGIGRGSNQWNANSSWVIQIVTLIEQPSLEKVLFTNVSTHYKPIVPNS